ncbi:hypothetical protein [Amycolatopsis nigrescens]|uniref:hypothetical protein n=1 Tax=Amycolatopsis nigrescens TaxID=381445 RepID=UPI00037BD97A|nr:hypothetical protein [Amycolatopsis nigrescens]
MNLPLAFVRYRSGAAGEGDRVVHLVALPPVLNHRFALAEFPFVLTALCGCELAGEAVELLPKLSGMPCVGCLRLSPAPEDPETGETIGPGGYRPRLTSQFRISA